MDETVRIDRMSLAELDRDLTQLGEMLHAVVHDGASIGFVLPFSEVEAKVFWTEKVRPEVAENRRHLFVARLGGTIAGSVQLTHAMPANQPHRVDVNKLMVHPDCRRRGIAKLLMTALEETARTMARSLITLDTRTGDKAEPLYAAIGYVTAGIIPNFCRDAVDAARLDPTTVMYKEL